MTIGRKMAVALGAAALATSGVVASAGAASAGGNGQQISFYESKGCTSTKCTQSIKIGGYNQYGNYVVACFNWNSSTFRMDIPGWWWKGSAVAEEYSQANCGGSYFRWSYKDIPVSQSGDWFEWWNNDAKYT